MKKNLIFLTLGIVSSIISKTLQFSGEYKMGNIIILFSAIFFISGIAFSNNKFNAKYMNKSSRVQSKILLLKSCLTVLLFQIMMMLVVAKFIYAIIIIIPILYLSYTTFKEWKLLIIDM